MNVSYELVNITNWEQEEKWTHLDKGAHQTSTKAAEAVQDRWNRLDRHLRRQVKPTARKSSHISSKIAREVTTIYVFVGHWKDCEKQDKRLKEKNIDSKSEAKRKQRSTTRIIKLQVDPTRKQFPKSKMV